MSSQNHLSHLKAITRDENVLQKQESSYFSAFSGTRIPLCTPCDNVSLEESIEEDDHKLQYNAIPLLEVGATVRYIKNDHVEKGVLVGVNITDQSNPSIFTIEFHDGRRVETTRENLEMLDTPDLFDIPVFNY